MEKLEEANDEGEMNEEEGTVLNEIFWIKNPSFENTRTDIC